MLEMRGRFLVAAVIAAAAFPSAAIPTVAAGASPACPANAKKANLNFTLKDTEGRNVKLSSYAGKVLLLDFWATWCGPCKIEIPVFEDLYTQYKPNGFEVAGVVVQDRFPNARPFAQRYKMNYTILDGEDRADLEDAFGPFWGLPTTFIIARDGRLCYKHVGLPAARSKGQSLTGGVKQEFEAEIKSLF